MVWYERMNKTIDYIEAHLCDGIDFNKISAIVCQSPVNFQRTFSTVTDISVFEYIRRRKLYFESGINKRYTEIWIRVELK
jgi:AraC family transcriptional regulator